MCSHTRRHTSRPGNAACHPQCRSVSSQGPVSRHRAKCPTPATHFPGWTSEMQGCPTAARAGVHPDLKDGHVKRNNVGQWQPLSPWPEGQRPPLDHPRNGYALWCGSPLPRQVPACYDHWRPSLRRPSALLGRAQGQATRLRPGPAELAMTRTKAGRRKAISTK